MRQGDSAYLRHILDAVFRIDEYTEGMLVTGWTVVVFIEGVSE